MLNKKVSHGERMRERERERERERQRERETSYLKAWRMGKLMVSNTGSDTLRSLSNMMKNLQSK